MPESPRAHRHTPGVTAGFLGVPAAVRLLGWGDGEERACSLPHFKASCWGSSSRRRVGTRMTAAAPQH